MRARSLPAHGRAVSEPRRATAQSQGRMPGDRALRGFLLFGYFLLDKQEKVTRSQDASGTRRKHPPWPESFISVMRPRERPLP